ncbi:MAG: aspartate aminotransferase family protein [Balneolaceae bacterium]|nr:aspartate aminotransferase family protein [Balneolaceae bacterium]MBO6547269.1 aspartate aminotransferase family protein [Balneolaceae bacterium]MBO6647784.1 aspartate aminotransferase family protein [Balneolaceae bacterium]
MNSAQALEKKHHFQVYNRFPITIDKGLGAKVWDVNGEEYIDLLAGIAVNNLGHSHPAIVEAIKEQAEKLLHVSNFYYTDPQSEFIERLSYLTGLDRVFLCNSGMEAMEGTLKLARKWGHEHGKTGNIISLTNGFHGRSLASITLSKPNYQEGFAPLPSGFIQSPYNDFDALLDVVDDQTIAIAFELIQGNSGVNIADKEFVQKVRALCDEQNILLIIDEVQTGVARTGKFWCFEHYGIKPDIIASAKALAGGIPIGAIIAKEEIASVLGHGNHGTTFGGNPFAAAVGNACLKTIQKENLTEQAAEKGAFMMNLISEKTTNNEKVVDVRGMGLMIGVELSVPGRPVVEKMFEHKVLSNAAGGNVLRIVPPLVISQQEIEQAVDVLVNCI